MFKPIQFGDGLNIIFGDLDKKEAPEDGKENEHNLGKTSLLNLVDFLLLKELKKGNVFSDYKKKFNGWIFFLELELNKGGYLTIRRGVDENTKISFKEHSVPYQDFTREVNWDVENISIGAKEKSAKDVLNQYLQIDLPDNYQYRAFLSYLMRDQYDYSNIFQPSKYKGVHATWKGFLFKLMGFDDALVYDKSKIDGLIKSQKTVLNEEQYRSDSSKLEELKLAIEAKEIEADEARKKMDSFDFYSGENAIDKKIVEELESKISQLNQEKHSNNFRIKKIVDSQKTDINDIDFSDIKQVFDEVKVFFPDELERSYEEVINFSKTITSERNKHLSDELKQLKKSSQEINRELQVLNKERIELLSILNESDSLEKYKSYQSLALKTEKDIAELKAQLERADLVKQYQNSIDVLESESKEVAKNIGEAIGDGSEEYKEIRTLFLEIYKQIMGFNALLIVSQNQYGNVDFDAKVMGSDDDLTGKGSGYTSKKILCACFALAVVIYKIDKSFYKFIFHDGLLESWGNGPKEEFIKIVREFGESYGLQYIITMIRSDLPPDFSFNDGEIVRTLDESDTLFGFGF